MNLSEQDRRGLAAIRDQILYEQIAEAERAVMREMATHAAYLEAIDHLAIMTMRYEDCRRALWVAAALAGAFFLIAVAVVRGM